MRKMVEHTILKKKVVVDNYNKQIYLAIWESLETAKLYPFLFCVGKEIVNVYIGVSDGDDVALSCTQNDNSIISPSELSKMTNEEDGEDEEEYQEELSNVYTTTTMIKNLRAEELGIQFLKLTSGEFAET